MLSPDKHKNNNGKSLVFNFYRYWAYDLEGLTPGTRQYIIYLKKGSQSQGSLGFDFFFFF
ncbi:hypothetical protein CN946_06885 [Bacillus sp. AFS053548]|nr:hypothetical protein CN946_06885 [Bacillus sp. AFS053548]